MRWPWLISGILLVACGSSEPTKTADDVALAGDDGGEARKGNNSGGPQIDSEVGALDQDKVEEVFSAARNAVKRCFGDANDGLDFEVIGGDIKSVFQEF